MPRSVLIAPGGMVFHVLNRGVGRMRLFGKAGDHSAFENIVAETLETRPLRICPASPPVGRRTNWQRFDWRYNVADRWGGRIASCVRRSDWGLNPPCERLIDRERQLRGRIEK